MSPQLNGFATIPDRERAQALAALRIERHRAGYAFYAQGKRTSRMYVLLDGSVRLDRDDGPGTPRASSLVAPSEAFGVLGLAGMLPAPESAVAESAVSVGCLTRQGFEALTRSAPAAARHLKRLLAIALARELQRRNRQLRDRMRRSLGAADATTGRGADTDGH